MSSNLGRVKRGSVWPFCLQRLSVQPGFWVSSYACNTITLENILALSRVAFGVMHCIHPQRHNLAYLGLPKRDWSSKSLTSTLMDNSFNLMIIFTVLFGMLNWCHCDYFRNKDNDSLTVNQGDIRQSRFLNNHTRHSSVSRGQTISATRVWSMIIHPYDDAIIPSTSLADCFDTGHQY